MISYVKTQLFPLVYILAALGLNRNCNFETVFYAGDNCPLGINITVELCKSIGGCHNER